MEFGAFGRSLGVNHIADSQSFRAETSTEPPYGTIPQADQPAALWQVD